MLDRRFSDARDVRKYAAPRAGWVRAVRDALGMSAAQLGRRLGVSGPAVTMLERSERDGTIKLETLRRVAAAMDCTLVYVLVPNNSLEETVRQRAERIVDAEGGRVAHTMALEDQATEVSSDAREEVIEQISASSRLWD